PAHDAGLDNDIVRRILHDRRRGTRVEQPHEVILEREVKAALPRVALTTRAASELVVDSTGFVALGADDVEPAGGAHLLRLGLDLGPDGVEDGIPCRLVLLGGLNRREALLMHSLDSSELGV